MSTLRYATVMQVYSSWGVIRAADHALTTEAVYRRLFELEPKARVLFDFGGDGIGGDEGGHRTLASSPAFLLHVRSLFDMLDLVVSSLGPDLEPLADELVELGRRHRDRGVRPDHLRAMERAFVDGIGALLGERRCPKEDRDAWGEILRFLTGRMAAGMDFESSAVVVSPHSMNVVGGELVHGLSSVVTVRHSGWYGFCLQLESERPRSREEAKRQHSSPAPLEEERSKSSSSADEEDAPTTAAAHDGCKNPCCDADRKDDGAQAAGTSTRSFELCIETQSAKESSSSSVATATTSSYPLPFVHEGMELNQSLRVGKVLFLERNSIVQVKKRASPEEESKGLENAVLVRWRLVPHHLAKDAPHRPRNDEAEDDALRILRQPRKKTLVCAECRRGFVTLRDVATHLRSRHDDGGNANAPPAQAQAEMMMMMMMMRGGGSDRYPNGETTTKSSPIWTEPLAVVYNDDVMSVVVKPQGMPVMGSSPSLIRSDLLVPLLQMAPVSPDLRRRLAGKRPAPGSSPPPSMVAQSDNDNSGSRNGGGDGNSSRGALLRKPRPAHRLDSGTGGLLVVAKTLQAEAALKRTFATGQARKTYVALVVGGLLSRRLPRQEGDCGVVDAPLSGKPCRTLVRTLRVVPSAAFGSLTEVELRPETGRRHQLRRHMQLLGHPILGDARYTTSGSVPHRSMPQHLFDADGGPYSRLCLWAARIRLPHPTLRRHPAEEEVVECGIPEPIQWLEFVLQYEREQM